MRRGTGRKIVTGLAGAAIILAFSYLGAPVRASDTAGVVNNALKATSVAGGFDSNFSSRMYVMTVTNGDTNDIVSILGKNGSLSTFMTLPPRASGETSPRVDIAVVRAADGEFKNFLNHLLVSRGPRIYLISPTGVIVLPSPLVTLGCASINSIVVGSDLFDRELLAACADGKIYRISSTGVAELVVDFADSSLGRIDIAPANFWHGGNNYGRRIIAYRQSGGVPNNGALLLIGPTGDFQSIDVPAPLLGGAAPDATRADARAVPSALCSYLDSPAGGSVVIASDAFVRTNNRNAIYRSPDDTSFPYVGKEGQVLLIGSEGSRVLAKWGGAGPILDKASLVAFSQVHDPGTPVFNGMAFCPVFYAQGQISPTSATPGSPGKGITTGNITFIIFSIKDAFGNIVIEPQSPGPRGVNQATIGFGPTGTEATAVGDDGIFNTADDEVKCTKSQTDVNNDGLADLHCSAKASVAMLQDGVNGVVTFTTNSGNPRGEFP